MNVRNLRNSGIADHVNKIRVLLGPLRDVGVATLRELLLRDLLLSRVLLVLKRLLLLRYPCLVVLLHSPLVLVYVAVLLQLGDVEARRYSSCRSCLQLLGALLCLFRAGCCCICATLGFVPLPRQLIHPLLGRGQLRFRLVLYGRLGFGRGASVTS
jgi:hypothetical protein